MTFLQPPFWAYERGGFRAWPQHLEVSLVAPPVGEPLSIAEAKSQVRLDASAGEPAPATAPIVGLAGLGAGAVDTGSHRVALSFVTADGETPPGPLSAAVTVVDKAVDGQIAVSGIALGGTAVTTVKLWLTAAGTVAPLLFAGSVPNGVLTAVINLADVALGAQAPMINTTADAELALWLAAARLDTQTYTGRAWMTQSIDVTLSHFPFYRHAITIPIAPLQRVTGIDYVDASGVPQTMDPSLYDVSAPKGEYAPAGRVMLKYGQFFWPFPPAMRVLNGVTIHCDVGYGTAAQVPATAKTAMKLLIGNWWINREAGQIIRGSADVLPYGVDRVLDPFRLESVA